MVVSYFTAVSGNSSAVTMILIPFLTRESLRRDGCRIVCSRTLTLDYYQVKQCGGTHKLPAVQEVGLCKPVKKLVGSLF